MIENKINTLHEIGIPIPQIQKMLQNEISYNTIRNIIKNGYVLKRKRDTIERLLKEIFIKLK